jgi:hypothetical protein
MENMPNESSSALFRRNDVISVLGKLFQQQDEDHKYSNQEPQKVDELV